MNLIMINQITKIHLDDMLQFYTPLVSDTMDRLGIKSYVIDKSIQSNSKNPDLKFCGFAYPCLVKKTDQYVEINKLLEMIDSIPKDSFIVIATDSNIDAALWGGMMSAGAKSHEAVAAMVGGEIRDISQINSLGFEVYSKGHCIKDIRTRGYMDSYNVNVNFYGIEIKPNDVIFSDVNGVVVIPKEKFFEVYFELLKALDEEKSVFKGLSEGKSASDLFNKFNRF